jgi:hypothetical protein
MDAYHWSIAQISRLANVNEFSAKHISVDSSADLRWQLEEWRVCCIDGSTVGRTVSIQSDLIGKDTTYISFSCLGDFWRFSSLDGLTLGLVLDMLVTCQLVDADVWIGCQLVVRKDLYCYRMCERRKKEGHTTLYIGQSDS